MNDTIPILKEINFDYQEIFMISTNRAKHIDEDFFEQVIAYYPNAILDIFDIQLDKDSEELKYLNSEYFKLKNEDKYLNFIAESFQKNSYKCFVDISIDFKNYQNFIYYSSRLDEIDKYLLLEQLINLKSTKNSIYLVEDLNLLKMFTKGILREIFHATLFFPEKPLLLFSNFDLSLPLVCKNQDTIEYYREIAKNNKLYFR